MTDIFSIKCQHQILKMDADRIPVVSIGAESSVGANKLGMRISDNKLTKRV